MRQTDRHRPSFYNAPPLRGRRHNNKTAFSVPPTIDQEHIKYSQFGVSFQSSVSGEQKCFQLAPKGRCRTQSSSIDLTKCIIMFLTK